MNPGLLKQIRIPKSQSEMNNQNKNDEFSRLYELQNEWTNEKEQKRYREMVAIAVGNNQQNHRLVDEAFHSQVQD